MWVVQKDLGKKGRKRKEVGVEWGVSERKLDLGRAPGAGDVAQM